RIGRGRGEVGVSVSRKLLRDEGHRGGAVERPDGLSRRGAGAIGGSSDQIGQAEGRRAVAAIDGALEREQAVVCLVERSCPSAGAHWVGQKLKPNKRTSPRI